jgi:hypothetical protein
MIAGGALASAVAIAIGYDMHSRRQDEHEDAKQAYEREVELKNAEEENRVARCKRRRAQKSGEKECTRRIFSERKFQQRN